ncbi:MAG: M23 family metallopeptidase [Turneriella sp.]|nr:M23 family metallopeptidase [Turneriella sp.]
MKALVSTAENLLTGEFRYPRDEHKITSPFFIKRVYERFKIVHGKKKKLPGRISYHGGTDLKGLTGAPVFAIADGIVNLADHLYYEGNIVIIDHGNGVISGYMHQSELLVKTGDRVKAGQLIGRTGDTGMVTGPHLHIFLYIHGVKTDPLSLLHLPVEPALN